MKQRVGFMILLLGLLPVFISGCQTAEKPLSEKETAQSPVLAGQESQKEEITEAIQPGEVMEAELSEAAPLQFVKGYGIVRSEYPVYILDETADSEVTNGEAKAALLSVVRQGTKLIAGIEITDYSNSDKTEDIKTLSHLSERYRDDIWRTGDGLILTGPDIPEEGYRPLEAEYIADIRRYEKAGYKRYLMEAQFEIPAELDFEKNSSGYGLQLLDFENIMEFTMTRAPGYETLEALAAGEGAMDTHDGISVLATAAPAEDGILVDCYSFVEKDDRSVALVYIPPFQEVERPELTLGEKIYPAKENYRHWDKIGAYWLDGISAGSQNLRMLFDVPENEMRGQFTLTFPGVTFRSTEEMPTITLPIPEDSQELTEEITSGAGTVRLVKITKMQQLQAEQIRDQNGNVIRVVERPAVYLEVRAEDAEDGLALRGLICQRKLDKGGWENQRYDFDENGNLSGFRVFYDDGDTSITLKFSGAAIYWEQPFVLPLQNCM